MKKKTCKNVTKISKTFGENRIMFFDDMKKHFAS